VQTKRGNDVKKDILDQVEDIEVAPGLTGIDPNVNEDSREYHETLIR